MGRGRHRDRYTAAADPRRGTRCVFGDAQARAIDDDTLASGNRHIAFLRWSCPVQTPSSGGLAPTANRSAEPRTTHFTLAPDYRSLSKDALGPAFGRTRGDEAQFRRKKTYSQACPVRE